MQTYISMLRGINVSGQKMIKMAALKDLCTDMKFENVRTYIQSGNIIFQSTILDTDKISKEIKSKIEQVFGFDVPVLTLTKLELETVISENPFVNDPSKDPAFLHVTFLSEFPAVENIERLQNVDIGNDKFEIIGKALYLYCPNNYSKSKLTNSFIENKLKLTATTRNWKTTNQIYTIAGH